jgi:hypothetical protein
MLFPPDGEDEFVLLHGAVDAESLVVCFRNVDGDAVSTPKGDPVPEAGLDYGGVLRPNLDELDPERKDIQPLIFSGELELLEGLDCAAALALARELDPPPMPVDGSGGAGGSDSGSAGTAGAAGEGGFVPVLAQETPARPLRFRTLPALPRGTLTRGRHILAVITGCLGGPGFSHEDETALCGDSYTPARPTLTLAVVSPWRQLRFDKVGLMTLNASRAAGEIRLESVPPMDATDAPRQIASGVAYGALVPGTASFDFSAGQVGFSAGTYSARVVSQSGSALQVRWSAIQVNSELEEVTDGATYVAALLGPRPDPERDVADDRWWNPPVLRLLRVAATE